MDKKYYLTAKEVRHITRETHKARVYIEDLIKELDANRHMVKATLVVPATQGRVDRVATAEFRKDVHIQIDGNRDSLTGSYIELEWHNETVKEEPIQGLMGRVGCCSPGPLGVQGEDGVPSKVDEQSQSS